MPFRSRSGERPRPTANLTGVLALAVTTLAVVAAGAVVLTGSLRTHSGPSPGASPAPRSSATSRPADGTWLTQHPGIVYPILAAIFVAGVALLIRTRPASRRAATGRACPPLGQAGLGVQESPGPSERPEADQNLPDATLADLDGALAEGEVPAGSSPAIEPGDAALLAAPGSGEAGWPDYLKYRAPEQDPAARDLEASDPPTAAVAPGAPDLTVPDRASLTPSAGQDAARPREMTLSPVALRILGAQRSSAQRTQLRDMPARRHRVALGDYWIDVVLAETPAAGGHGKPLGGHTWLAASPYLAWAPLPHDVPEGGVAFVCVGAGDEGCLFIDLAAAPGAISIGGDPAGAARLAESIARQLCVTAGSDHPSTVLVVGAALPRPLPSGSRWVETFADLKPAVSRGEDAGSEIVICELASNEEAFALARYTNSASGRVIPVILANIPDAPWSFTAEPLHGHVA